MTKSIAIIGCGYVGGDAATALRYSGYRVTGTSRSTQGLIGIRDIVDEAFLLDISDEYFPCLLYTSPSPRDQRGSRMPSSA